MAVNRESWCVFEKVTLKVVSRAGLLIREALLVDTLQVVERKHPHPGDFKAFRSFRDKIGRTLRKR